MALRFIWKHRKQAWRDLHKRCYLEHMRTDSCKAGAIRVPCQLDKRALAKLEPMSSSQVHHWLVCRAGLFCQTRQPANIRRRYLLWSWWTGLRSTGQEVLALPHIHVAPLWNECKMPAIRAETGFNRTLLLQAYERCETNIGLSCWSILMLSA